MWIQAGAARIAQANLESYQLRQTAAGDPLTGPGCLDQKPMLLRKIARGRSHDRALADYNFASLAQRLSDVIFADEVRWFFDSL